MAKQNKKKSNPSAEVDMSIQKTSYPSVLEEVGLEGVELPLRVQWGSQVQQVIAKMDVFVSLDHPLMKGIHMSRLYLSLYEFSQKKILTLSSLEKLLSQCIASQKGISSGGRIIASWKGAFEKKALKSSYKGWHTYPCSYEVTYPQNDSYQRSLIKKHKRNPRIKAKKFLNIQVLYSSTCPCSAALSRGLIQNQFKKEGKNFSYEQVVDWLGKENSIAGTPHSQRSLAKVKIQTDQEVSLPLLIQGIEKALATPVQTAVKRADEKQFAHLNSQNLMYSEDAVRKIKHYLKKQKNIIQHFVKVRHFESLHPFDTSASIRTAPLKT